MIIEQTELIKLAIDGLNAKIEKKQNQVWHGENILTNRSNGISDKSPFSDGEIRDKILMLKQEISEIYTFKTNLQWADEIDDLKII